MSTTCKINFDNNRGRVVYAGQLVRGTVQITLQKEKMVRSVYVQLAGCAYARWVEGSNRSHIGNEDYLMQKVYLLGGPGEGAHNEILLHT